MQFVAVCTWILLVIQVLLVTERWSPLRRAFLKKEVAFLFLLNIFLTVVLGFAVNFFQVQSISFPVSGATYSYWVAHIGLTLIQILGILTLSTFVPLVISYVVIAAPRLREAERRRFENEVESERQRADEVNHPV